MEAKLINPSSLLHIEGEGGYQLKEVWGPS